MIEDLSFSAITGPVSVMPVVLEKTDVAKTKSTFSYLDLGDEKEVSPFLVKEGDEQDEEEGIYQFVESKPEGTDFSAGYERLTLAQAMQDLQESFPLHQARVLQLVVDRISEYVKKNGVVFGGMTFLSCCLGVGLGASLVLGACSMGLQASRPDFFDVVRSEVWQLVGDQMQEDRAYFFVDGRIPKDLGAIRNQYIQLLKKEHPDKNQAVSATAKTQQIVGAYERYCNFWKKGYRPSERYRVVEQDTI